MFYPSVVGSLTIVPVAICLTSRHPAISFWCVCDVQLLSKVELVADQPGKKSSHHCISSGASPVSLMWWCNLLAEVLRSISLRKNMRPAGKILHANESLQIRDSNSVFVHFLLACKENNACSNPCFHSEVMLASIAVVLRCMPKNVS